MLKKFFLRANVSSIQIIVLTAVFWVAFANFAFISALLHDYPLNLKNAPLIATALFGFAAVYIIVLSLFCFRWTMKPLLIVLLIATSQAAYFMDAYHVIIDDLMIATMFETDPREVRDLLSPGMFLYLVFLGIIPAIFVYRANIRFKPFFREVFGRIKLIVLLLMIMVALYFSQSAVITTFFREHKPVRYYANPAGHVFGAGRLVHQYLRSLEKVKPLVRIGEDAKTPADDATRELVIFVVGETTRADRFSLNGYARETNPLLKKQDVVSFTNVRSCATLTAISVPCMFSVDPEDTFKVSKSRGKENVLDVIKRTGANVLWLDNNSSSKGVADRVENYDFRNPKLNPVCDVECRDEGMVVGLQDYIDKHPQGDIIIVLHAMGNHGPAYYKRYPKAFARFKPECETNELGDCAVDTINNSYDNAILYGDYFLDKVIELLKKNDEKFETAMLYVGDHGESLGDNNVFLHGLPNFLAPKEQRHVPMIMWVGKNFHRITLEQLQAMRDKPLSHDNIFHTLLGLMEIQTKVYDKKLDMSHP